MVMARGCLTFCLALGASVPAIGSAVAAVWPSTTLAPAAAGNALFRNSRRRMEELRRLRPVYNRQAGARSAGGEIAGGFRRDPLPAGDLLGGEPFFE